MKLKVNIHTSPERRGSVSSYMVGDDKGVICGGAKYYIPYAHKGPLDYPSWFTSKRQAKQFIRDYVRKYQ